MLVALIHEGLHVPDIVLEQVRKAGTNVFIVAAFPHHVELILHNPLCTMLAVSVLPLNRVVHVTLKLPRV
jgi:hypothetical protein